MSDPKITIDAEKRVTINDLVSEANAIHALVRQRKPATQKASEQLLQEVNDTHRQFCAAYPIIARYICHGEYDARVFRKWLKHIKKHPWKDTDQFFAAQADYVVRLYMLRHPRAPKTHLDRIRKGTYDILMQEHEQFKQQVEAADQRCAEREKALADRNRASLKSFVELAGPVGMSTAEVLRVDTSGLPAHTEPLNIAFGEASHAPALPITAQDILMRNQQRGLRNTDGAAST